MLLIARWANSYNLSVDFYLVGPDIGDNTGIYDPDGDHYNRTEVEYFLQDSMTFVTALLDKQLSTVHRISDRILPEIFESLDNIA